MSTINDRIDAFIAKFDLKDTTEFREGLGDFVAGCWEDHFKICMDEKIPHNQKSGGGGGNGKVTKSDKIEDPSECKEIDDLRNCTSATLDEYCKTHGLRIGGTKKEKMDRVWRHLQGNNSDSDISPRGKAKKEKKVAEKHSCYGCTSKGTPCAVVATVEVDGQWFCWRHEETAAEIIAKKGGPSEKPKAAAKKEKIVSSEYTEAVNKKKKKAVKEPSPPPSDDEDDGQLETDEE
jgi:hypothetical protein